MSLKIEERNRKAREKYLNNDEYKALKKKRAKELYYRKQSREIPEENERWLGDFPRGRSQIGYIYIITNPAYPEYLKIGKTVNLGMRLSTYNTGSPFRDYKYEFVLETKYSLEVENHFNEKYNSNNEWCELTVEEATKEITEFLNNRA